MQRLPSSATRRAREAPPATKDPRDPRDPKARLPGDVGTEENDGFVCCGCHGNNCR